MTNDPQADQLVVGVILQWVSPILLGLIGYFLRTGQRENKATLEELRRGFIELDKSQALTRKDIELVNTTLANLKSVQDGIRVVQEDVTILKRDQITIWKRIDEIKQEYRK